MRIIDAEALKAKWYEINDIGENDRGARFVGYTEIARLIDQAPTAEAVQGWIPVSERLPSESGRYLVTYPALRRYMRVDIMHFDKPSMPNIKVKGRCWYIPDDEWGDVVYDEILAWMPLPKPYERSET